MKRARGVKRCGESDAASALDIGEYSGRTAHIGWVVDAAVGRPGAAAGGRTSGQGHQSAWAYLHPVPKLPLLHKLEANPLQPRIQSRFNGLSAARHACQGALHTVPLQSCLQKGWNAVFRLPRGYSPPPVWRQLSKLP